MSRVSSQGLTAFHTALDLKIGISNCVVAKEEKVLVVGKVLCVCHGLLTLLVTLVCLESLFCKTTAADFDPLLCTPVENDTSNLVSQTWEWIILNI